jgi:anti-sigma B factor antagonist
MNIETSDFKRCTLIKTSGRIDGSNAPELAGALKALTDSGKYKIVFDMDGVNFMASAGWWVLIDTQKTCKQFGRGELLLANVDPGIRESLNLVGMGDYFQIFNDVTTAVGSF